MKVYRAGVIPYYINDGKIQMLFMKPSDTKYGGDSYQVAKGKVEDGESDRAAAFREANEELGLITGNILRVEDLGVFLGRTTIFIAKIVDPEKFREPHYETDSVSWMTLEQFQAEGRELHRPMVNEAVKAIVAAEEKQKALDEEYGA